MAPGNARRMGRAGVADLAGVAALVAAGWVVVLAAVEQGWMDVAPAFAILTLPAVAFLAWRGPMPWARVLVGTAVFGAAFGFFFEVFQESGDSYRVVAASFPELLGVVPVDSVLAHMLMTLLTLAVYERFVLAGEPGAGTPGEAAPGRRARYGVALGGAMVVAVVALHAVEPGWVDIPYSYAVLGTAAIVPPVALALRRPAWLRRLRLLVPVFLVHYLVMEVVAVRHSWWVYPAERYLGWVTLPGPFDDVRFPVEELLFWMLLYAAALASYHEIFLVPKGPARRDPRRRPLPAARAAVRGDAGEGATEANGPIGSRSPSMVGGGRNAGATDRAG